MMFELDRLPAPDERGFFQHPDIPGEDESDDIAAMIVAMGYACRTVDMDADAPELSEAYHMEEDHAAALRWIPTSPGANWLLVAVYETEDGPYALFVCPLKQDCKVFPTDFT